MGLDLNYYYLRHQISLIRAKAATTADARAVHNAFADSYAALIARERDHRMAEAARDQPLVN